MASVAPVRRYNAVAQTLHWLLAIGLGAMVAIGLAMTHAGLPRMTQFKLYQLHKSIGITVLVVALVRLLWRLSHPPPALPGGMPRWEKGAAHASHALLYVLMIGLPLVGWAMVSLSPLNIPTVLFGVVPWPHVPGLASLPDKRWWEGIAKLVHAYGAYLLIGLVALHALAALRHHFVVRDDVLARMVPGLKPAASPGDLAP